MKKLMDAHMHAQARCTDSFTPAELEEAKAMLLERQTALLSMSYIGSRLRQNVISTFKKLNRHLFANPDYPSLEELGIACDLVGDADVANAIATEAEWQDAMQLSAQLMKNGEGL